MSQRINSYLNASQELRQLSYKVEQILALQQQYEQIVSSSLACASHVMQLDQKTLMIAANNGAVAAKLRQLAPRLAQLLRTSGHEITAIQVKVQVTAPPTPTPSTPATLSSIGQKKLISSAEKLPDSMLKCALQRLASKKIRVDK